MSTVKCDTLSKVDGLSSVPVNTVINGSAKAWVNFNGAGTVSIRSAFNVSSITDVAVGSYGVNFTNAMPNALYSAVVSCAYTGANPSQYSRADLVGKTTTYQPIATNLVTAANNDSENVNVTVFG